MTTALILLLPNFQEQFIIETNTLEFDIGIILMQQGHPIAYIGKSLTHKWRSYLAGTHFVIKDDNFCLTYILEQNIFTP